MATCSKSRYGRARLGLASSILVLLLNVPAAAQDALSANGWPDTRLARTQALAMLETLNADLLSHPSATLTLERWCAEHRLAAEPRIVAQRVMDADRPLPAGARAQLQIGADEPVRYRRVRLTCGTHVLSDADNWYVPSRLTRAMNQRLDATDEPFGKIVQALHFRRETLSAQLLWSPLPENWDSGAAIPPTGKGALTIPPHVLEHRALLYTSGNQPFSLVVETYTSEVLPPAPR